MGMSERTLLTLLSCDPACSREQPVSGKYPQVINSLVMSRGAPFAISMYVCDVRDQCVAKRPAIAPPPLQVTFAYMKHLWQEGQRQQAFDLLDRSVISSNLQ